MGCWVGLLLLFHCCCLSHGVFSLALDSMLNILAQEENTCILSLVSAMCLHCRTRKSQLPRIAHCIVAPWACAFRKSSKSCSICPRNLENSYPEAACGATVTLAPWWVHAMCLEFGYLLVSATYPSIRTTWTLIVQRSLNNNRYVICRFISNYLPFFGQTRGTSSGEPRWMLWHPWSSMFQHSVCPARHAKRADWKKLCSASGITSWHVMRNLRQCTKTPGPNNISHHKSKYIYIIKYIYIYIIHIYSEKRGNYIMFLEHVWWVLGFWATIAAKRFRARPCFVVHGFCRSSSQLARRAASSFRSCHGTEALLLYRGCGQEQWR